MKVTNHDLLRFRGISPIIAFIYAMAVYIDVNQHVMFPFVFLQMILILIAKRLKKKKGERSCGVVHKGALLIIMFVYGLALALGILVSMTASSAIEAISLLLIYVVFLDALMAIPFVLSFTNYFELQRVRYASGTHSNHADSQMFKPYDDSGLSAHDSDTYWHQSPHYTASSIDSSPDVNPASGLIMVDNAIDVAGNFYGFNDHSFSNDISQTNQFSDYDYHNNN